MRASRSQTKDTYSSVMTRARTTTGSRPRASDRLVHAWKAVISSTYRSGGISICWRIWFIRTSGSAATSACTRVATLGRSAGGIAGASVFQWNADSCRSRLSKLICRAGRQAKFRPTWATPSRNACSDPSSKCSTWANLGQARVSRLSDSGPSSCAGLSDHPNKARRFKPGEVAR